MGVNLDLHSLVTVSMEQELSRLHEKLNEIRSEAQLAGQYGGSRHALQARTVCEKVFQDVADKIYVCLKNSIIESGQIYYAGISAHLKNMYLEELSYWKTKVDEANIANSASYYHPISTKSVTNKYQAEIYVFSESIKIKDWDLIKQGFMLLLKRLITFGRLIP